jgi:putative FmdB family regulatory protein
MPKYNYRCLGCGKEFDLHHSMFEIIERCILCEAEKVEKIPSLSFFVSKAKGTGKVVKEFIKDAEQSIKEEKKKLKEEYND